MKTEIRKVREIGLQITESMLPVWTAAYHNEIAEAAPSIQTEEQMVKEASYKMVAMHSALRPVYNKWIDRISWSIITLDYSRYYNTNRLF